jgi:hypothetical protein
VLVSPAYCAFTLHCDDHLSKAACSVATTLALSSCAGALAALYFHWKVAGQRAVGSNIGTYFASARVAAPTCDIE